MIVTSIKEKNSGHVIIQQDHADLAWQIASALGNKEFFTPEPEDIMLFLAKHHDHGWNDVDSEMLLNPEEGLPYNLVQTPFADLLATGPASVDYNETFHPLAGLLASMHVWGLYNGRYGLSDKIVVDLLPEDKRALAEDMLATELSRQKRLKEQISQDPSLKAFAQEDVLFRMYKQLQFFDTLSLYFNELGEGEGQPTQFHNVPSRSGDVTVSLEPLGQGKFHLSPFPFSGDLSLEMKVHEVERKLGSHDKFDKTQAKETTRVFQLVGEI